MHAHMAVTCNKHVSGSCVVHSCSKYTAQSFTSKEWDLSTRVKKPQHSRHTFNSFSQPPHQVCMCDIREKQAAFIHLPYWRWQRVWPYILSQRNLISGGTIKEGQSVLFLRGGDLCGGAAARTKENNRLSLAIPALELWSYSTVCIIPKCQRPFPGLGKVIWTSFPSGLSLFTIYSSLQPPLVLISHSQTNQGTQSPGFSWPWPSGLN